MNKRLLFFLAAIFLFGCTTLKTPEIKGVVVDAETGKPIDGARIYARWQKVNTGPGGQSRGGISKEITLIADKNGRFVIPAHLLINFVPYPFGQGGYLYLVFYTHNYKYKKFELENSTQFKNFLGIQQKEKVISLLRLENNPGAFLNNSSDVFIYAHPDGAYVAEEDKIFVQRFDSDKWKNEDLLYQLVYAYSRLGEYRVALNRLEEIPKLRPDAQKDKSYWMEYNRLTSKLNTK